MAARGIDVPETDLVIQGMYVTFINFARPYSIAKNTNSVLWYSVSLLALCES